MNPARDRRRVATQGFTLLELLVSLIIMIEVILVALTLFDFSNKLARVQTQVAGMQQSSRVAQTEIVRLVRMAGRGSLSFLVPAVNTALEFNQTAIGIRDNVAAGTRLTSDGGSPLVLAGTDVLTLRGVFGSPVFQRENIADADTFVHDADGGVVILYSRLPTGHIQSFAAFQDAIDNERPEAILMVSLADSRQFAVGELDPNASSIAPDPLDGTRDRAVIAFKFNNGRFSNEYRALSPPGPRDGLDFTGYVGILEEYRFYIRDEGLAVAGSPAEAEFLRSPALSRGQLYPGTETPHGDVASNLQVDVADYVFDLQASLGVDLDSNRQIVEADPPAAGDEWLFNAAADDATTAAWAGARAPGYLRISTLTATEHRDFKFQAPLISRLENRDYSGASMNTNYYQRQRRRRIQQTVIELRNL